jgi:hypothetical protein
VAGTPKSVNLGYLVQITLGVGLIDLAAVGHQDQLQRGKVGANVYSQVREKGCIFVATCILDLTAGIGFKILCHIFAVCIG